MSQVSRRLARLSSARIVADSLAFVRPLRGLRASPLVVRPLAMVCCVGLAPAAWAQADVATATLDPVVVTATRTPQRLSRAIADVTVFGREEVERRGSGSVVDLLRGAAGIEIVRNGGPASTSSCFVRGADSRFMAVLVDGVRMDTQSGAGGASWESLPLSEVDRIEVVRGGAGAIYGSDAIGGVVQIFTRKGQPGLRGSVAVGVGSRDLRKMDARISGGMGDFDYALGAAVERSRGFSVKTDAAQTSSTHKNSFNPDDDGYLSRGGSLRLGWQLSATQRIEAGVTAMHADAEYDNKPLVEDHSIHQTAASHVNWVAQWLPQWRSQVTLGQSLDHYKTEPSPYDTRTRLRTLSWVNNYNWNEHSLSATVERREDHLDNSSITSGVGDRSQNAIGVGDLWTSGALALQAHVRHDQDSEFGGHDTALAGGAWEFVPGWRARVAASNSFRAPTLYQRFSPYGSATLKPEQGFNVEAGLNWRSQGDEIGLTVYRNRVRDLIVYGAPGVCPSSFGCYENVGVARLQGVTLEGRSEVGPVRLSGSVDLLSPKNAETDKLLARRARRHASLKADTDVGAWTLGAQVLASGMRYDDAANTPTKKLSGYAVLNLDAQWRLAPDWRLETRVDNVFDHAYETAQFYRTQPRQFYVGVRWSPR